MTDAKFLAEMQALAVSNSIVFLTRDQVDVLRDLAQTLPVIVPAEQDRYAMQATALADLIRRAHQRMAARVAQQLRK
jgi:hypothetical protein